MDKLTRFLQINDVCPMLVFDGVSNPKKIYSSGSPKRVKTESEAKKAGWDTVKEIICKLRQNGIPYMVSYQESDHQLTFLLKNNLIDMIYSKDTDFIMHLCYHGLNLTRFFLVRAKAELDDLVVKEDSKLNISFNDVALCGCDYGVGIAEIALVESGYKDMLVFDPRQNCAVDYTTNVSAELKHDSKLYLLGFVNPHIDQIDYKLPEVTTNYWYRSIMYELIEGSKIWVELHDASIDELKDEVEWLFPEISPNLDRNTLIRILSGHQISKVGKSIKKCTVDQLDTMLRSRGYSPQELKKDRVEVLSGILRNERSDGEAKLVDSLGTSLTSSMIWYELFISKRNALMRSKSISQRQFNNMLEIKDIDQIMAKVQKELSEKTIVSYINSILSVKRQQNKTAISKPERNLEKRVDSILEAGSVLFIPESPNDSKLFYLLTQASQRPIMYAVGVEFNQDTILTTTCESVAKATSSCSHVVYALYMLYMMISKSSTAGMCTWQGATELSEAFRYLN